jgi:hypothetical protein
MSIFLEQAFHLEAENPKTPSDKIWGAAYLALRIPFGIKVTEMKQRFLSFTILLLFFLTFSFTSNVFSQTTPISQYGKLKVVANHLCDVNGLPIQLRGMSSHGLQWFGWGDGINEASLDALAHDWQSGIFRVAMYVDEGGYKTDPSGYKADIDTMVDEALERRRRAGGPTRSRLSKY